MENKTENKTVSSDADHKLPSYKLASYHESWIENRMLHDKAICSTSFAMLILTIIIGVFVAPLSILEIYAIGISMALYTISMILIMMLFRLNADYLGLKIKGNNISLATIQEEKLGLRIGLQTKIAFWSFIGGLAFTLAIVESIII